MPEKVFGRRIPWRKTKDIQSDAQVRRDAQQLLDEYFRIRREYNSLDRDDPAHAPRRALLKERYYELDRKYTELIRARPAPERPSAAPRPRSRAKVLWEGAFSGGEPAGADMSPVDAQWIELNTPAEGRAADEVFEEALRTLATQSDGARSPGDAPAEVDTARPAVAVPKDAVDEPVGAVELETPVPDSAHSLGISTGRTCPP